MTPVRQSNAAQWRRTASQRRRDGALHRVSSITSAVAVATVAAVGVLGVYVAKALPGHQATSSSGATTATVPAGSVVQGANASSSSNSIGPPSTPPQAASAPAQVVSGSS